MSFARRLALALALGACGGDGEPGGGATDPAVEVGTGAEAFEEIGESVPLILGPQGGFHVWMAVRCRGVGPRVTIDYGVHDAATGEGLSAPDLSWPADLRPSTAGPGYGEFAGLWGFLLGRDTAEYVGRRVRLWARVTDDATGRALEGDAETVVDAPDTPAGR